MKKIIIYAVLIVSVLIIGLSGCLGNDNNNNGGIGRTEPADIRSITIQTNGSDVIALIVTELDLDESLDRANITVKQSENTIRIYVPAIEPSAGGGSNIAEVKIGNISQFDSGVDYTVIVNNEVDRDEIAKFRFENKTLITFKKAPVRGVTFEAAGNEIIAVAEIPNVGRNDAVDEQNMTIRGFDHENEMDIYVPLRIQADSAEKTNLSARISIASLNQLRDGGYSVEINDYDAYFVIRNGALAS